MDSSTVRVDVDRHVATVRFTRPERRNAFTPRTGRDLVEAVRACDLDDDVRAVVVCGSGGHFCAGADLEADWDAPEVGSPGTVGGVVRDVGGATTLELARSRTPLVAAVAGAAVGIGATLTLPMDVRVLGESARMGFVFGRLGLAPEAASSWYLPRLVPPAKALEWMLTGRMVGAREALAAGLANHVVPDDEVEATAHDVAREIAERAAPVSVAMTRHLLWRGLELASPWEAHVAESAALARRLVEADFAEGTAAFLGRRPARFTSRVPADLPPDLPAPATRPSGL